MSPCSLHNPDWLLTPPLFNRSSEEKPFSWGHILKLWNMRLSHHPAISFFCTQTIDTQSLSDGMRKLVVGEKVPYRFLLHKKNQKQQKWSHPINNHTTHGVHLNFSTAERRKNTGCVRPNSPPNSHGCHDFDARNALYCWNHRPILFCTKSSCLDFSTSALSVRLQNAQENVRRSFFFLSFFGFILPLEKGTLGGFGHGGMTCCTLLLPLDLYFSFSFLFLYRVAVWTFLGPSHFS